MANPRWDSCYVTASLTVDRFKAFAAQGAVKEVRLAAVGRGFALLVDLNTGPTWLHTEKGGKRRIFSRAETAFKLIKDAGLLSLAVDLMGWKPENRELDL